MRQSTWMALNKDTQLSLNHRFVSTFTPESTFKAITGAIGLSTGK